MMSKSTGFPSHLLSTSLDTSDLGVTKGLDGGWQRCYE